ncbi:MAG TPA: CotH kinase family protein [Flavobacteriales bacterium]
MTSIATTFVHYLTKPFWTLCVVGMILCGHRLCAQFPMPDFGAAFLQDEVSTIRIFMDTDALNEMIEEQEDEMYYHGTFIYQSSLLHDTIEYVGIRLRGNTSLNAEKKSFRISFNAFEQGAKWQELEKLNLIAQQNDPSLLRSKLCHDAYRYYGITSCRTSYVKLYINDEYRGLYLHQEHIDEEFAKKYFDGQGDGNLYKCTYPAPLQYLGSNPDLYKLNSWNGRIYDLRTNEWRDNYSDLAQFITVLNNTPINNLACELPKVFNVESYLKVAALNVLLGNWDGYIYNQNNYYLYQDQRTGLITYIPYDLDNTLGIDWVDRNWAQRNIYNWAQSGQPRPLYWRLLQVPEYRERFSFYIHEMCQDYFTPENFYALSLQWQQLIASAVENDPYYSQDFGYTYNDFLSAITTAWGGHVDFGIVPYVTARRQSALQQLDDISTLAPNPHWLTSETIVYRPTDIIHLHSFIGSTNDFSCDLWISSDNASWTNTGNEFADNGAVWDVAADGIFSYFTANNHGGDKLYYKLNCDGYEYPCSPKFIWTTKSLLGVYINEVMSSNSTSITDEYDEHEDWIELYNSNSWSINLNGKYLTDDLRNWNKFPLPPVSIGPGEFLIIYMDDQPYQGQQHATFKVGGNDTDLYLINVEQGVPRIADHFNPVIAPTDVSLSRLPDGGATITLTSSPTPGATNGTVHTDENKLTVWSVYPNPSTETIKWNEGRKEVILYDLHGHAIKTCTNCNELHVSDLAAGQYYLRSGAHVHSIVITR